jgi:hypothetical protein
MHTFVDATRVVSVTWQPDNLTMIPCFSFRTHPLYGLRLADNRVRWNHQLLAAILVNLDRLMTRLSTCAIRSVCFVCPLMVPLRYFVTRSKASGVDKHYVINMPYDPAVAGVLHVNKDDTQVKLACLFTKALPADRRRELLGFILGLYEYRERPRFPAIRWFRYLLREGNSWAQYAGLCDFAILMKSELRGLFNTGHTVRYDIGRRQPY